MPGPTPLSAPWRFDTTIVVQGLTHHQRMYVDLRTGGTGASGLQTHPLLAFPAVNAEDAIDRFLTLLAPLYKASDTTFGPISFEQRSGSQWIPIFSYATAVVPTATNATQIGCQTSIFGYTNNHERYRCQLMETWIGAPAKVVTLAGQPASIVNFINGIFSPASGDDAGAWSMSRGSFPLTQWVSMVTCLNRRVRRRRGLL